MNSCCWWSEKDEREGCSTATNWVVVCNDAPSPSALITVYESSFSAASKRCCCCGSGGEATLRMKGWKRRDTTSRRTTQTNSGTWWWVFSWLLWLH